MTTRRAKKPTLQVVRGAGKTTEEAAGSPATDAQIDAGANRAAALEKPVRGVFECEVYDGIRTFSIRSSTGQCLRVVNDPAELVTPERVRDLWRFLQEEDPEVVAPPLRLL